MNATRVAIAGCGGKMGRALVRLASQDPSLRLVAAIAKAGDAEIGNDAGTVAGIQPLGLPVVERCTSACDVLIEFSSPDGCLAWAGWCGQKRVPLVSGTTGLSEREHAVLRETAARVPVVWSPNMSVGVNVLLALVTDAVRTLGPDWDVEIAETHHRQKLDAPSGTAAGIVESICRARGVAPEDVTVYGRSGTPGPRPAGQIGVHALRMGSVVGEHQVSLAVPGEIVTLGHRAESRDIFAAGALRAAKWVVTRPPGLYHMRDVLGL